MEEKVMTRAKRQTNDGASPKEKQNHPCPPDQSIAVYTIFFQFIAMKQSLGLEAALEYVDHYMRLMEQQNPRLKNMVKDAVKTIDVSTLYKRVQG